ncbi:MAG TPA: DUF5615 family PIN-like protein [Chloroflexota bacterium]|jgi:predicted nuclease of predicted toxin-antitoxin system
MSRFLLDEDIPLPAAVALRQAGYAADHAVEVGLQSQPDPDVFSYAQTHGAVLITADLGFADIRTYPPGTHAGIIVVRFSTLRPIAERNEELVRAITQLEGEDLTGLLVIVQMGRTRIRRPPPRN